MVMRIFKFESPKLDLGLNRNILIVSKDVPDVDTQVNYLDR